MAKEDIIVRLRLAGEQFSREFNATFKKAANDAERSSGTDFEKAGREVGSRLKVGIVASLAGVGLAINRALDFSKGLDVSAKQIGINVERLQEYRYAAAEAGVSAQDLDGNLADLTRRIGEAKGGSREAQQAFVDLGVGFETVDGQARSVDATFLDVFRRLSDIKNPADRARLGMKLFGEEFYKLEPLLAMGEAGFRKTAGEARDFGAVLTSQEIKELSRVNAELDRMKITLGTSVARVVYENRDAIESLANAAFEGAGKLARFADEHRILMSVLAGAAAGGYVGGPWGAAIGAGAGLAYGAGSHKVTQKENESVGPDFFGLGLKRPKAGAKKSAESSAAMDYYGYATGLANRVRELGNVRAPVVSPKPSIRRGGGSSGGSKSSTGKSEEERAEERAWEAARKFREELEETVKVQEDIKRIEALRAEGNEDAAVAEETRLKFLREHPLAVHQTVEELAKALGLSKQLTAEERKQLQAMIDKGDMAERVAVDDAGQKSREERESRLIEERQREYEEMQENLRRQQERDIRDLADLYEDLFNDGVSSVWGNFKREGKRVLAEIAAQYTLGLLSGQSQGGFGQVAQGVMGRSPLGMLFGGGLFGGSGGLGSSDPLAQAFDGVFGADASRSVPGFGGGMIKIGGAAGGIGGAGAGGIAGALGSVAGPLMLASAANSLIGEIFGFKGGPLGVFTSLFKKTKKGSATIGGGDDGLSVLGITGNSKSRKAAAGQSANSVIDMIDQIAEALGAEVDASRGSVSIGVRKKSFRVDPSGSGYTKTGKGAIDFGQDEEAAIRAAVADLITDGVLTGISAASQKILKSGQELEKAIEKASLIEAVPKLLKQRLDPLGFQLEEIDAKFRKLADAMQEGGGSAEQIAQARQLWQLERADAIQQIGEASAGLKDFLASLKMGSDSPLSLRQQRAEAEAALKPYADKIAAGEKIDQDAFATAAQQLLGIARSMDGSGGGFFETYDRITQLTKTAIDAVDKANPAPGAGEDPFAKLTASNTGDAVNLLADQNELLKQQIAQLQAVNDNIAKSGLWWVGQNRNFV